MKTKLKIIFSTCNLYFFIIVHTLLVPSKTFALELDGSVTSHKGEELTNNSIKQIVNIFTYVGAFAIAVGIIQVILSFKDENADGKTKGIITVIVGIGLISLDIILKAISFGYK